MFLILQARENVSSSILYTFIMKHDSLLGNS